MISEIHMNKKSAWLIVLLAALFLILNQQSSNAQLKNISLSAGLVTTQILGDNPGTWPVLERDTSIKRSIGGSFRGNQPGFGFKLDLPLDKNRDFVVPLGFEYIYYRALERVPLYTKTTLYIRNSVSVPTGTLGLNWFFMKFPIANVRSYAGIEARGSFLRQDEFYRRIEYPDHDEIKDSIYKQSAFRMGAALKLGIEGEFLSPWYVTTGLSFDAMNLIGRDNTRGELLTPMNDFETSESVVWNMHFYFMIQYRFN